MPYLGNEWKESIELKRFYLSTIQTALTTSNSKIVCNDINGNLCIMRDRTVKCLQDLFNNPILLNNVLSNPIKVSIEQDKNIYSSMYGIIKFII